MTSQSVINASGRLIARDGYIIPLRIGSYLLDTFHMPVNPAAVEFKKNEHGTYELDIQGICMGTDTISWRKSYTGGTVEPGESLLEAAISEDSEEAGEERDPVVVNPTIISFLSRNTFADETEEEPVVGNEYKLRTVFRTKSTVLPVQQGIREEELYPELIKPGYRFMTNTEAPYCMLRPSFLEAFQQAYELNILYGIRGRKEVVPDYDALARKWEALRIHPDIIEHYCVDWKNSERWQSEIAEHGETLAGLMQNLEYAEKGLHQLLKRQLPHHAKIRKLLNAK